MNTLYFYDIGQDKVHRYQKTESLESEYKTGIEYGHILGAVSGSKEEEEEHFFLVSGIIENLTKKGKEDYVEMFKLGVKECEKAKKEDKEMADRIINKSFEDLEADLKKESEKIEKGVTDVVKMLSKEDIKEIFSCDREDSYKLVLDKANAVLVKLVNAFGENNLVISSKAQVDKLGSKIEAFLSKHGKTKKVFDVVKAIIKKVCAVALNLVKFTGDVAVVLATLVGRIAINAGKETISAGKEVKNCFKNRFL